MSPTCAPAAAPSSAGAAGIPAFIGAETPLLLTLAQSKDFAAR